MKLKYTLLSVLFAIVILAGCKKYEEKLYTEADLFSLKVTDTAGVRYDGRTIIRLLFSKTVEVKDGMKITFETSKGSLLGNDIPVTANEVSTQLKVDQDTGMFFIKAFLKDAENKIKAERRINFSLRPALPDTIGLEPDRLTFNFTNNKVLTMQTYLSRKIGLVTKGTTIAFRAYQLGPTPLDTTNVGRLTGTFNNFSGVDGKLQNPVLYYSDTPGIDPAKPVYITAFSKNDRGETISRTLILSYVP